jgi:hypothetical protein
LATGIPASFTIDPATVRQKDKDTSKVTATVILESPSPSVFICELRSAEPRKVSFGTLVFKKGDLQEVGTGLVHWKTIFKEARVRVTAFSVDAPDRQISFTVVLKPKAPEEDSEAGPVPNQ